jgi:dehydrogenase/reductase SDR family protein 7B
MAYFQDKTIWITGASSGIGEACAQALSAKGAKLILSARREKELERVKNLCTSPEKIKILPLDLEAHENVDQWVGQAWALFDGIDILLNNGGIGQFSLALETQDEVEKKIMDINFFGNIKLSKALLPKMLEAKKGQIMSIGSIAANFGQAKLAAYSASKAALKLYYESLKEELLNGPIKIQVVSPGFIKTSVTLNSLKGDGTKVNKNSPAQENGMPAEAFAQKLLKAMESNKFHSYIGKKELMAVPLHGLLPNLFYKLLRK